MVKDSAQMWSQKEGKASAVRQQMLHSTNSRIRSVAVAGFTYSIVSLVSIPSSVGMAPSRLLSERSLHTHGAPKEGKATAVGQQMLHHRVRNVGVAGFAYSVIRSVRLNSSVGMAPSRLL